MTFVPKMPNYKMETIYAYKMARSLTIIDYNHPIASKEAHNILPHPKCRDISYKWWNVVFLKVHQALYKISKEYQTVLGRHSLHSAYWPKRQVCSIPVYWQFLQFFYQGGGIRYGKILKPKVTLWRFFTCFEDFISSVRSSNSHNDLLLIHHHPTPTFSDHTGPQYWTFTFWATIAI